MTGTLRLLMQKETFILTKQIYRSHHEQSIAMTEEKTPRLRGFYFMVVEALILLPDHNHKPW
jgi:hypothetical protein